MGLQVTACARNQAELKILQSRYPNITSLVADLSTEEGRQFIAQELKSPLNFILHNAARLDPPQPLSELNPMEFRNQISVNVEPILFLTQKLLSSLQPKSRILVVSSGAAKQGLKGLSNYCVSKSAAWMATEMLRAELKPSQILTNHYFPGVVDTEMQATLRKAKDEVFEYASEFRNYHKNKVLSSPESVAQDILNIFTQTNDHDFFRNEWQKS